MLASKPILSVRSRYRWIYLLCLMSLCFPALGIIRTSFGVLFPHYFVFAFAIPVLLLSRFALNHWVLLLLGLICLSTLFNVLQFSLYIMGIHIFHLLALSLLSRCPVDLALSFAKFTVIAYVAVILITQIVILLDLTWLVGAFVVVDDGVARVSAFATEPSYASMIILILSRFVLCFDKLWFSLPKLSLVLLSLLATLSLYAVLCAAMLFILYMIERNGVRGIFAGVLVTLVALIPAFFLASDFLFSRVSEFDLSQGIHGINTGTIRLLPWVFAIDRIPESPWLLLIGAGAGSLDPLFFSEVGQFRTDNDHLSTHMAGAFYDYGLLFLLASILMVNSSRTFLSAAATFFMTLMIMLNCSVATYLFVIFGSYALIENKNCLRY